MVCHNPDDVLRVHRYYSTRLGVLTASRKSLSVRGEKGMVVARVASAEERPPGMLLHSLVSEV